MNDAEVEACPLLLAKKYNMNDPEGGACPQLLQKKV